MSKAALVIVDVQNDFLPGGSLAVLNGGEVIPPLVKLATSGKFLEVITSQDWHPSDHCSFREQGGDWPVHCVAYSKGALLDPRIEELASYQVRKGSIREKDAYSALDGTGLSEFLRARGVETVFVGGLATDYCVKATALALCSMGFSTFLLTDAIRAVDVTVGDGERAIGELFKAGVKMTTTNEVLATELTL